MLSPTEMQPLDVVLLTRGVRVMSKNSSAWDITRITQLVEKQREGDETAESGLWLECGLTLAAALTLLEGLSPG